MKLESLAKLGARIQPQKDGSVMLRTTETTTSAPVPGPPGNLQPQMPAQHQVIDPQEPSLARPMCKFERRSNFRLRGSTKRLRVKIAVTE